MPARIITYVAAGIIFLVITGAIGWQIIKPTNKTVIQAGGRVINLTTSSPQVPLGGCSIWRVNARMFYEKGFKLDPPATIKSESK